jgi:hypothetical protein
MAKRTKKQKYKITATRDGFSEVRISTVPYTHAIYHLDARQPSFWSQSREAAEAKARTNHIQRGPKVVLETVVEPL